MLILTGHRKIRHPEKEFGWLIFHYKIEQTVKIVAVKVVRANKKLNLGVIFRELIHIYLNKLRDSVRVEFVEHDITMSRF